MGILSTIKSFFLGKERPVDLKLKNATFQSCFYCFEGGAKYRIDLDNKDVIYVCEKHRNEHHPDLTLDASTEAEFPILKV
jgi:hypothetical protein